MNINKMNKSNLSISRIVGLIFSISLFLLGCMHTKDMEEKYLMNLKVDEILCDSALSAIKISGHYGESAYGIEKIDIAKEKDAIYITGKVATGKLGEINLTIDIPFGVDKVYFGAKEIWRRKKIIQVFVRAGFCFRI